jgi:hypothetical protein
MNCVYEQVIGVLITQGPLIVRTAGEAVNCIENRAIANLSSLATLD